MSANVCNVCAVVYLTGGERNSTMAKIRRIVFILERLITIGNVPNLCWL